MEKTILVCLFTLISALSHAAASDPFVSKNYVPGSFCIARTGRVSTLMISDNDHTGVNRAARDLQSDLEKVTGISPSISGEVSSPMTIIIGTIGHSAVIDRLISSGKINVGGVAGKWESTLIEVVKDPVAGVDSALVIAGSDKRGTIYGIYELSYQIGVSPWYYWADVPVKKSENLYAISGRRIIASPAVKYRGIFLNDEAPALSGWTYKTFGGFNSKLYEKVFELILRLKGNYLWPAMWGNAFNDDDNMNPVLADQYGIVIGTSHHEPLTRAHDEWKRYKGGKWNYEQNPQQLREFWESGLERVADKEQIITIGMRGDGDEPMSSGTATALLEKIVSDQREIISRVTKRPASETPQIWALYKEVQDYYDKGMRVPDDVTLLLADDNWGNLRKLPRLDEAPRAGGYGVYYHFDYVGGPRNYKWLNTNPIQKVWEQMNLAYNYNANQIWIVNVGDLKPMEFPIEFFLDYAWAPEAIPSENLISYMQAWAGKQFEERYAIQIAELLDLYGKYSGRIKPELLNDTTYSLVNYNEFEYVASDFDELLTKADFISRSLPENQRDAFYQLVLHPVQALGNLYKMYLSVAKNRLYSQQGRNAQANYHAYQAARLYQNDAQITSYYNKTMANGKWDHMMDQTHIGYTSWQQPEKNTMPKLSYPKIQTTKNTLGVAVEGSTGAWHTGDKTTLSLPAFDFYGNKSHYIDIFGTGLENVGYDIKSPGFIIREHTKIDSGTAERIQLRIDWAKSPKGKTTHQLLVTGREGSRISVPLTVDNRRVEQLKGSCFLPQDGVISMEAPHFTRQVNSRPIFWKTIGGYGKTVGGVIPVPVSSPVQKLGPNTPHLQYDIYVHDTGRFDLHSYLSPTLDFTNSQGLQFAVSIDDQSPVVVNISSEDKDQAAWGKSVANGIKISKTPIEIRAKGKHTLKYWMITPGVVLQKLVLDLGGLRKSYLGPPESVTINSEK